MSEHLDASEVLPSRRADESGSKFYHAPWGSMDCWKMVVDEDKHSGSDHGAESHGKREGKIEKFSMVPWANAVQHWKKGWFQEFLAFEPPSLLNKKSESLASLFRITQHEAGWVVRTCPLQLWKYIDLVYHLLGPGMKYPYQTEQYPGPCWHVQNTDWSLVSHCQNVLCEMVLASRYPLWGLPW